MKYTIIGQHERFGGYYHWQATKDDIFSVISRTYDYAIVETQFGYQMIKICGVSITDDSFKYGHKKVVKFLDSRHWK